MKKKFPYSRQSLDNNDIKAVIKILKADIITRGGAINNFENKISKFVNSKYSVAVNSATRALHIACMALNIKKMIWFGQCLTHLLQPQILQFIVVLK